MLLPTVASAGQRSMLSIIPYSAVVIGWSALRGAKALQARAAQGVPHHAAAVEEISEEMQVA
ncbi:MAG: hypothetical protein HFJ72_07740 [Adlercreutzia sp.]|nr:hypothetical protein [Adlercreutzia sp.]